MTISTDHIRQSIRKKGFNYAQEGFYFITVCTESRVPLFGEIKDERMHLNLMGDLVRMTWFNLVNHFPYLLQDAFVVMPNHIHGILHIDYSREHSHPRCLQCWGNVYTEGACVGCGNGATMDLGAWYAVGAIHVVGARAVPLHSPVNVYIENPHANGLENPFRDQYQPSSIPSNLRPPIKSIPCEIVLVNLYGNGIITIELSGPKNNYDIHVCTFYITPFIGMMIVNISRIVNTMVYHNNQHVLLL